MRTRPREPINHPHLPCSACYGWHPVSWACDNGPASELDAMLRNGHANLMAMYCPGPQPGIAPTWRRLAHKAAWALPMAVAGWLLIAAALGWRAW